MLQENRDDTPRQLEEAKDGLKSGQVRLPKIEEEIAEAKRELKHIQRQHTAQPSDVQRAQRKCECLQHEKEEKEEYLKQCRYDMAYCQHYLDKLPPGEAPEWPAFALGALPHQPTTPTVDPLPCAEGSMPSGGQHPSSSEDVEMQDEAPQGAVAAKEPLVESAPLTRKTRLCSTRLRCLGRVIGDMRNLMVCSPSNPTSSQSETKL